MKLLFVIFNSVEKQSNHINKTATEKTVNRREYQRNSQIFSIQTIIDFKAKR